jgi:hypothetical protein
MRDDILREQLQYYRDRASEYDQWFLRDGRTYRVIKFFYDPDRLIQRLQSIGWTGQIEHTANFFLYSLVHPKDQ